MICKRYEKCPFFNGMMANMPSQSERLKQTYCLKDFSSCARAIVAERLGVKYVPNDMFPDDMMEAAKVVGMG